MEEVDEIVIHGLKQIGCDIKEDIRSLREFTTELVIESVVRCLHLINPSLELSHNVPPSMSARYRIGSILAAECIELGYKGEIGYQTFLYANEADVRKVFLFLFENLPKESEKVIAEPLGKTPLLLRECSSYFKECLHKPWLPYYCTAGKINTGQFFMPQQLSSNVYDSRNIKVPTYEKSLPESTRKAQTSYFESHLPVLKHQVESRNALYCSVLEENAKQFVLANKATWVEGDIPKNDSHASDKLRKTANTLIKQALKQHKIENSDAYKSCTNSVNEEKGSRFSHVLDLQFTSGKAKETTMPFEDATLMSGSNKEEERRKLWEEEIQQLQDKTDDVTAKIAQLELQNKKLESSMQQMGDLTNKEREKINSTKESYKVKKYTLSLLSDADNNIEKLESLIESSSQRLVNLASQWEQHRVPLIEKYRDQKQLSSQRLSETQSKLEEIKQMHEKIADTGNEARYKDEMHKQLKTAYEKLTKDLNRSAYTKRILEIVGNIKKQKAEIDKVLLDTRNVQKEINRLSGKLDRTFTVTDELIFRDAKKDEAVRKAYKLLAALHENCSQLVLITEESGFIVRKIRELEDQIEQEGQKKVVATLERIMSDYKQMQLENASLIAQLK